MRTARHPDSSWGHPPIRQPPLHVRGGGLRNSLVLAMVALMVLLAFRQWVVEPLIVASDSMEPTIASRSVVFLYKPVDESALSNGTVVAFRDRTDDRTAIKRIIAKEGQTVAIRDAELYVDDILVAEPFVDHSRIDATYFGPVTVAAGTIFVLGDNRAASIDSRDFGAIPVTAIEGIVLNPTK